MSGNEGWGETKRERLAEVVDLKPLLYTCWNQRRRREKDEILKCLCREKGGKTWVELKLYIYLRGAKSDKETVHKHFSLVIPKT